MFYICSISKLSSCIYETVVLPFCVLLFAHMNKPEIEILKDRINRLRTIYLYALEAFHAYEQIQEYRNTGALELVVAQQHALDIGAYKGFMVPAERGLNMKLHIELAKLFIPYKGGLHLPKLVSFAKYSQVKILASSDARDIKGCPYQGLSEGEWLELESELECVSSLVKRLKVIRDKQVAHENINHPETYSYNTYDDLSSLIDLSGKILNKISIGFYGNSTWTELYREQVIDDTVSLLHLLSKHQD